ncbi:MAG: hypothetical protein J5548_13480 [Prevotella sp.]|nr:hypothetical protein [Prevotella sp.]
MKKVLFFAVCLLAIIGCKEEPKAPVVQTVVVDGNDSLQAIIDQREKEMNDLMSVFNEIQEGFRQINEKEKRVTLAKAGEGVDKVARIKSDMQFIKDKMNENRLLIEKLRGQLSESSLRGEEIKKTLENTIAALTSQLEAKNQQYEELVAQLNAKDVKISEMDNTITTLNKDVEDLKTETAQKQQTINEQDKQMHIAYYVYGTKSELKEQGILTKKGEVLEKTFNKNYFTKIDYRYQKEIKLFSKSAKFLTSHPQASYQLERDAKKEYVLRITNPDLFWSTSKYLVVLVK